MKTGFLLLPIALILASCTQSLNNEVVEEPVASLNNVAGSPVKNATHSNLVKFDEDLSLIAEKDPESIVNKLGAVSIERLFPDAGEFEARSRKEGLHRWYRVHYNTSEPLTKAHARVEDIAGVEICEEETPIKTLSIPFNDPYASKQWHYFNDGSITNTRAGYDINVVPVWENYTVGNSNVIVGVVDAGVDYNHYDLSSVVINENSLSFVPGYGLQPGDHGTHVAGTIAAVNNNGKGVCGIAGGDAAKGIDGVKILSCQIFADDSNGESVGGNSAAAIKWAADHGAVICNNSWGYVYKTMEDAKNGRIDSATKEAIDYFNKYAGMAADGVTQVGPMAGGLVIFAAGNDGWPYGHPADYEGVMAVGAFDAIGGKAYYSNYGDWVDIAAPGGSAYNQTILSTLPGNQVGSMQGTSMACPHVSGVAALVVSYFGGPGFTREMLWDRLVNGANDKFPDSFQMGRGIDVLGAMTYGMTEAPETPQSVVITEKSNTVNLAIKSYADPSGVPVYGFLVVYGKDKNSVDAATPSNLANVSKIAFVNDAKIGDTFSGTIKDLDFESTYYLKVFGYTYSMTYSDPTSVYTAKTDRNNPPVINTDLNGVLTLRPFDKGKVTVTVSEPDGHDFTVKYTAASEADAMKKTDAGYVININPTLAEPGQYTSTIVVTDKYGAEASESITYELLPNTPPALVKPINNQLVGSSGNSLSLSLDGVFTDEDGETLKYTVASSNPGIVNARYSNGSLTLDAVSNGTVDITVKAFDAKGESASCTFKAACANSNISVSMYPNPASEVLYIRPYEEGHYTVEILAQSGAKVYSETANISFFEPLVVDMTQFAAGTYVVTAKSEKVNYSTTVVKR